jgi:hypothetical protein
MKGINIYLKGDYHILFKVPVLIHLNKIKKINDEFNENSPWSVVKSSTYTLRIYKYFFNITV